MDDAKGYREFLHPAGLVNAQATLRIVPASEFADEHLPAVTRLKRPGVGVRGP